MVPVDCFRPGLGIIFSIFFSLAVNAQQNLKVERWRIFEMKLKGPANGNPFTDINLYAEFTHAGKKISADGFYDGDGNYVIRFMPTEEGEWIYVTKSNEKTLNERKGQFTCTPPTKPNHGPVKVQETYHFAYADGTRYLPFGTTSYAWVHQGDSLGNITIKTLEGGYFNKIRMCIFPKNYEYNRNEPLFYPFEGKPLTSWDYTHFNPAFFRNIEKRIAQLDSLGIQADLILFHSYDHWGFQKMGSDNDTRYLKYLVARLSAYKNVWWSIANEYDLLESKSKADWDRIIATVSTQDPYGHLLSIHQAYELYDHSKSSISHVSVQSEATHLAGDLRARYHKPVIYDECRYEGNIRITWGNLTPQEMVNKFWRGFTKGAYVGHGETYTTEKPLRASSASNDILWWSKGGSLKGMSQTRIKFMRTMFEAAPGTLEPVGFPLLKGLDYGAIGYKEDYFLVYFNMDQPVSAELSLPDNNYTIEIIDTYNMIIKKLDEKFSGTSVIKLPQKPGTALRIVKIN